MVSIRILHNCVVYDKHLEVTHSGFELI